MTDAPPRRNGRPAPYQPSPLDIALREAIDARAERIKAEILAHLRAEAAGDLDPDAAPLALASKLLGAL